MKQKKGISRMRQIMSILLALTLVIAFLPTTTFASAEEPMTGAEQVEAPDTGTGPAQTKTQETQPAAGDPAQTDKEAESTDTPTANIAAPEGPSVVKAPAPAEDEAQNSEDGIAPTAEGGRRLILNITQDGKKLATVPEVRLNWAFSSFAFKSETSNMDKVWKNVSEIDLTDESMYYGDIGFDIYDGKISHVTGTIKIAKTGDTVLTATLPSAKSWVRDLDLADWDTSYTPEVSQGTYTYKIPYKYGGGFDAKFYFGSNDFGSASGNLNFIGIKDDRWTLDSDYNVTSTRNGYYTDNSSAMKWYSSGEYVLIPNKSMEGTTYKMRVFGYSSRSVASGGRPVCGAATDAQGYVPSQEFTIHVDRHPVLDNVKLAANASASRYLNYTLKQCEGASLKETGKTGFNSNVDTYKVVFDDGLPASKFYFELFCAMSTGNVKGSVAGSTRELMDDEDGGVTYGTTVSAELSKFERQGVYYVAPVTVKSSSGGVEKVYTFYLYEPKDVQVTLELPEGIDAYEVTGDDGEVVSPDSTGKNIAVYTLKSGDNYQWKTTADGFYSAYAAFTPGAEAEQTVTAYAPRTGEDYMQSLLFSDINHDFDGEYEFESTPYTNPAEHSYTTKIDSNDTAGSVMARFDTEKYEAYLEFTCAPNAVTAGYPNTFRSFKLSSGVFSDSLALSNIVGPGGVGNDVKVVFRTRQADENGVYYAQDYNFHVIRVMSLKKLTATAKGASVPLKQTDSGKTGFLKNVFNYTAEVEAGTENVQFTFNPGVIIEEDAGKITVDAKLDGKDIGTFTYDHKANESQAAKTVTTHLDPDKRQQILTLTVKHGDRENVAQTYTVVINSLSYFDLTIHTDPTDASFMLSDNASGKRIEPSADGTYRVGDGGTYTYTVSKSGYITAHNDSFKPQESQKTLNVTLKEAAESTRTDISGEDDWNSFRGDHNNGVVDYPLPTSADDVVLSWATKVGDSYQGGAVSSPIIVGGDMYVFVNKEIIRLDCNTGERLASGRMAGSSSFSLVPPIYADGMIIVGLDGMVQAFDAKTLESLWVYHDPRGGQMNSSITYDNGYIYLGFWNSEDSAANFVCLSITDEDPGSTDEEKYASWTYAQNGGFYWTGAAVKGDYVLVTTDDGERGYAGDSAVLCLNRKTGTIVDTWTLSGMGDARTSISCDGDTYYFATKGGYFCKFTLADDGKFADKESLELSNGGNGTPMCTSTPVIAGGRAYVGVSGLGQFIGYSGHNITVIDLDSFSIAYSVKTQGYPQVSGLLTTAYTGEDGYNYVYFVDNFQPGKIRVIRDKKGMTGLDDYSVDEDGNLVAYNLFTPSGGQAQYAISSLIADADGNIYFKNDSGYLMCLSPVITKLRVVQNPDKMDYCVGETFDPAGMKVEADCANGQTRDVTKYITFTDQPLRADDFTITLTYDIGENAKMYQDKDGAPGTAYIVPAAELDIDLHSTHVWDKGKVTKVPTATETGLKTYTCTVCGKTKTESVPAVSASPEKPGTGAGSDVDNTEKKPGGNEAAGAGSGAGSGGEVETVASTAAAPTAANDRPTALQKQRGSSLTAQHNGSEPSPVPGVPDAGQTEEASQRHILPILLIVVVLAAGICFVLIARKRKNDASQNW